MGFPDNGMVTLAGGERGFDRLVRELFWKSNIRLLFPLKSIFRQTSDGTEPSKLLLSNDSLCRLGRPEKLPGIDPFRRLWERSIVVMLLAGRPDGIEPLN